MNSNLLRGTLVRLAALEPKELAEAISRWDSDSEYRRLLDSEPANQFSVKKLTEWIEKDQEKESLENCGFGIRALDDDQLVGFVGLGGSMFPNGDAFVGIGIGTWWRRRKA